MSSKCKNMTLGRKVNSLLVQKKSGEKSCSGLIHNHVILSNKSDKIREILKKKAEHPLPTPSFDETTARFFPLFFCTFFVRVHLTTERHMYEFLWNQKA